MGSRSTVERRGRSAQSGLLVITALTCLCVGTYLTWFSPVEAKAPPIVRTIDVEGSLLSTITPEELGVDSVGQLEMLFSAPKAGAFYADLVGDACGSSSTNSRAEMLLTDAKGVALAVGHLGETGTTVATSHTDDHITKVGCQWLVAIQDVPMRSGLYALSINGGKPMHLTLDELREPLDLTF